MTETRYGINLKTKLNARLDLQYGKGVIWSIFNLNKIAQLYS